MFNALPLAVMYKFISFPSHYVVEQLRRALVSVLLSLSLSRSSSPIKLIIIFIVSVTMSRILRNLCVLADRTHSPALTPDIGSLFPQLINTSRRRASVSGLGISGLLSESRFPKSAAWI